MSAKKIIKDLETRYTKYYREESAADSPVQSRVSMTRHMTSFILERKGSVRVLDVGSGRRELAGALRRNALGNHDKTLLQRLGETQLVSFDVAEIPIPKLIAANGLHVRADSRAMPFRSSIFDLTVSNLSIDMLRKDKDVFGTALQEAARVTAPEGMLVFHYHPEELFHKRSDFHAGTGGTEEAYYNGDEKDNPYYASPEEIAEDLTKVGIAPTHIEKKEVTLPYSKEISDSWWEVVGQRVE